MKDESNDPHSARAAKPQTGALPQSLKLSLLLAAVALGGAGGYQVWKSQHASAHPPTAVDDGNRDPRLPARSLDAAHAAETVEVGEGDASESAAAVAPTAVQTDSRAAPAGAPQSETARAEATPYARQLVANLTQVDLVHGPLT